MAASHPEMFQPSTVDESVLLKLVENHLLPSCVILQWQPTKDEDIPTPNTNKIVVLTSFFQRGFDLPTREFHRGLLYYYKIELVHLNTNTILQIFVHPNFSLFKHDFFLKYQPSAAKRQIIGGVDIQTRQHCDFLNLPLKSSLKG
jgi:hypothetical protein